LASVSTSPPASTAASEPAGGEGFLNVNSIPASLVVLDGKPIGSTPKVHVQVAAGPHTVVFTNSELGVMKEVSVTVGAGETKVATARRRA
jgi:serine/threonine-protein kinase